MSLNDLKMEIVSGCQIFPFQLHSVKNILWEFGFCFCLFFKETLQGAIKTYPMHILYIKYTFVANIYIHNYSVHDHFKFLSWYIVTGTAF